ncbi:MAG: hypothetical protein GEU90_20320 [Gemmatimonas sp.]|nr:hypothetical protein [Gemmatimonas sp.]
MTTNRTNGFVATVATAAAICAPGPGVAQEVDAQGSAPRVELTANAGWYSEYFFRGIPQKTSSANAGLDVEFGGLYFGTWAADVGDGAEVDVFGGYSLSLTDQLTLTAGGTGYFYTGDFDDTYLEANLLAAFRAFEGEFSRGRYENFDEEDQDYGFLRITGKQSGGFATFGTFIQDFDGSYFELGYEFEAGGFDLAISWLWSDEHLSGLDGSDNTLILGVVKTFDIVTPGPDTDSSVTVVSPRSTS